MNTEKTVHIYVDAPKQMRSQIKALAAECGMSLSAYVRELMRKEIARSERGEQK